MKTGFCLLNTAEFAAADQNVKFAGVKTNTNLQIFIVNTLRIAAKQSLFDMSDFLTVLFNGVLCKQFC